MANISDKSRDAFMLEGPLAEKGYDWWWNSFTGYHEQTGEEKSFFVEFFVCNPNIGGNEVLFGQKKGNLQNKDAAKQVDGQYTKGHEVQPVPSYLMVKCGAWGDDHAQLHRFFAWDEVQIRRGDNFGVKSTDCYLDEVKSKGTVTVSREDAEKHPEWMSDAGSMSWRLKINKKVAFHVGYGASKFFRKLNAFEMFWHAEGMKTEYDGYVIYNGERYIIKPENCYGYADKNWGADFTSPWVWLSSNNLKSNLTGEKLTDSVFDIGGGRPKVLGIALNRKLLSDFWYEGKSYEFNFSKFWTVCRTKFECHETDTQVIWHVEQKTLTAKMIADIVCEKKDMLLFNYEAPNGKKLHNRLWNGGNGTGRIQLYRKAGLNYKLIDDIEARNVGCEYGEY